MSIRKRRSFFWFTIFSLATLILTAVTATGGAAFYTDQQSAADVGFPPLPDDGIGISNEPWPEEAERMPDLIGGRIADRPIVYSYPPLKDSNELDAQTAGSAIKVWYDSPQKFGQKGDPQQWVNILGNISDTTPGTTLSYKLNSESVKPVTIGPNANRLAQDGDFNIEIDSTSMISGTNTVLIEASDGVSETVTVNYNAGQTWPEDYDAVWSSSKDIQNTAQVVDGHWKLDGNNVFIDADTYGYDRLLAIGDESWTDYEVTVPITVSGLDPEGMKPNGNGAGVGFIMRWLGHTNDDGEQPNAKWDRTGAIGWYRWNSDLTEGLELRGYDWRRALNFNKEIEWDTTYMFKMSVQSITDQPAYYRLKMWEASEQEPLEWDNQGFSNDTSAKTGSLLLVAHHAKAKFGEVKVRSLDNMRLKVEVAGVGEGSFVYNPEQDDFAYSERVRVFALPEIGYDFAGWTGDITGTANPADFRIYRDMNLKATFIAKPPVKLVTDVEGQGTITRDPNKTEYQWGEQVSLSAAAEGDFIFSHWADDLSGFQNPMPLLMDADKKVTAVFIPKSEESPQSDDFSQCELDTDLWTLVNPAGIASLSVTDNRAKFSIPAGTNHNMWSSNADAPRIMQPTQDKNFEVEAKFDSLPAEKFQMQGILVQQDEDNWLRFDVYHDGGTLLINAAKTLGSISNNINLSPIPPDGATGVYIKVERNGDMWTQSYSFNGTDWTQAVVFIQALEVNSSGIFAGNTAKTAGQEPAFTSQADYFFNTSIPIVPEDEGKKVEVKVVGQGEVKVDPPKSTYSCGEKVTLTATPANDWLFEGWSGDLSGGASPAALTVKGDHKITATFVNRPLPTKADAGGPYAGTEGTAVSLDASDTTNHELIKTYQWDCTSNGTFDQSSSDPTDSSCTYVDEGVYTVKLRTVDIFDRNSDDKAQVKIDNVAPEVGAGVDQTVPAGTEVRFAGSFTDPGTADTHITKWDFGDGSQPESGVNAIHRFAAAGKYAVIFTVEDDDGGVGQDTIKVTVMTAINLPVIMKP